MKIPKIFKYILYSGLGLIIFILIVTIGNTLRISYSDEYALAKEHLENNSELIKEIGEINEFGQFPSGGIRTENGARYAQIEITVEGTKSTAKVILMMSKQPSDVWTFDEIYIQPDE